MFFITLNNRNAAKGINKNKPVGFVFALWVLVSLACIGQQRLGPLNVNGTAVPFTLMGEVDYVWSFEGNPNVQYEVIVTRVDPSIPLSPRQVEIIIFPGKGEYIGKDPIDAFVTEANNSARAVFEIPSNQKHVQIVVWSLIAEAGTKVGSFAIEIKEIP